MTTRTSGYANINMSNLEGALCELRRAIQVAERLAIDSDGENELVVYAICNAAREAEVTMAEFYGKEAA